MIILVDGVAYFEFFSSQELGWVREIAPDKYQPGSSVRWAHPREVKPTDSVLVHRLVDGEVHSDWGYWTLVPPWVEGSASLAPTASGDLRLVPPPRTHFNSRKDTLTKSAGWKRLLQSNRCVLLANGFFEWSDTDFLPKGHPKMAGRYSLTGDRLMPLAAIWSPVQVDGREILTVSVVTCEPNAQLTALPHHRMPGILLGNDLRSWMDPKTETPEHSLHATPESEIEALTVWPRSSENSSNRPSAPPPPRSEAPKAPAQDMKGGPGRPDDS